VNFSPHELPRTSWLEGEDHVNPGIYEDWSPIRGVIMEMYADLKIKVILHDAQIAGTSASCGTVASAGANVKVKIVDHHPGTTSSLKSR